MSRSKQLSQPRAPTTLLIVIILTTKKLDYYCNTLQYPITDDVAFPIETVGILPGIMHKDLKPENVMMSSAKGAPIQAGPGWVFFRFCAPRFSLNKIGLRTCTWWSWTLAWLRCAPNNFSSQFLIVTSAEETNHLPHWAKEIVAQTTQQFTTWDIFCSAEIQICNSTFFFFRLFFEYFNFISHMFFGQFFQPSEFVPTISTKLCWVNRPYLAHVSLLCAPCDADLGAMRQEV